jgi:hypothetical protein
MALFVYLSTLHMCRAKRELAAADRLTSAPTSASNRVTDPSPRYRYKIVIDSIKRYVRAREMLLAPNHRTLHLGMSLVDLVY